MRKTENFLDSLRVTTKTMAVSSQKMESMTTQVTYLTWAIAILTVTQVVFGMIALGKAKAATKGRPTLICILPRAARRLQKSKRGKRRRF